MKSRHNFHLDPDQLLTMKAIAENERTSVAELVREGIDLLISERLNNPRISRAALLAQYRDYLTAPRVSENPERTEAEIDHIAQEAVRRKREQRKGTTQVNGM